MSERYPSANLEEMLVSRAAPTVINFEAAKAARRSRRDQVTTVMSDVHIGFFGDETMHDTRAMDLALSAIDRTRPDQVVIAGDLLDLPVQSRFEQRGEWQGSTQRSLDTAHEFLSKTRAVAPDAQITLMGGNHELRMDRTIRHDAGELFGIRRANVERELGVLTLEYLLRLDELGIDYKDGYPNNVHWLEDDLKVVHGTHAKNLGRSALRYLQHDNTSTIFGHDHRMQIAYKTIRTRDSHKDIVAASAGCLAKTGGNVPSYGFSVNEKGALVPGVEDWQQGIVTAVHSPKGHDIQLNRISERGIYLNGSYLKGEN